MTYEILLVDDEPIILSGIKFLIDWEKNNCHIAGTARNGKQALEAIKDLKPHIVICDINMPVMSGIEVLKAASKDSPLPVFIMLTNYGEFELAREALRNQAADYLLKSQLEPEILEHSLSLAKQEYEKRGGLLKVDIADNFIRSNKSEMITSGLKKLLSGRASLSEDFMKHLEIEKIFQNYFFISLWMDFSSLPGSDHLSEEESDRLFAWEQEVVEKLAGNIFSDYTIFDPDSHKKSLLIFCSNSTMPIGKLTEQFYAKLCRASGKITQASLSLLATDRFDGTASIDTALLQYDKLLEYYYNFQCPYLLFENLPDFSLSAISFGDMIHKLTSAIRTKNREQCCLLINQAIAMISDTIHKKSDALSECTSLYSTVSSILAPMLPQHQVNEFFINTASVIWQINCLPTRSAVCLWLSRLSFQLLAQLEQLTASKSELAEKARNYVLENVEKRIMLQDAADFVNLSPSYLSALFKKEYRQNFVDFINETKMERACLLIRKGSYRIYEISYMLGFDNAYYFTKVFKKHTGLTPTEYQRKH